MRSADLALYSAKSSGKGCFRIYEENMNVAAVKRRDIEAGLRIALRDEEFELYTKILSTWPPDDLQE